MPASPRDVDCEEKSPDLTKSEAVKHSVQPVPNGHVKAPLTNFAASEPCLNATPLPPQNQLCILESTAAASNAQWACPSTPTALNTGLQWHAFKCTCRAFAADVVLGFVSGCADDSTWVDHLRRERGTPGCNDVVDAGVAGKPSQCTDRGEISAEAPSTRPTAFDICEGA